MTLTQGCSVQKYRSGTIAEALRSGSTGWSIEECRQGMIRDGAQADAADPTLERTQDRSVKRPVLDLGKTGFTNNKENKEIVSNICKKRPYVVNSDVS